MNDPIVAIIGVIIGGGGGILINKVFAPLVKGWIDNQKSISARKEVDKFKLNEFDFRRIEKHSVFLVLSQLQEDFKSIYFSSRMKLPQKIFIYQMCETFEFLKSSLLQTVKLIGKHKSSNREDVINQISLTMIEIRPALEEFIAKGSFHSDINKIFFQWFNHHWQWYSNPTKEIISVQDSFFDMVNTHLIRTIDFIYAVRLEVKNSINDYNGDVEAILSKAEKEFNFDKYKYLI